jgi:hypothetical protein
MSSAPTVICGLMLNFVLGFDVVFDLYRNRGTRYEITTSLKKVHPEEEYRPVP